MDNATGSRILLGVDSSFGAYSAARWAADECRLRGGAVLMLHVPTTRPEPRPGWYPSAGSVPGWLLLDELAVELQARYPDIALEQLLGHGDPAGTLTDLSALADLVVLGTTGAGSNLTSMIGSVSARVAAQAHCPVVIVPEQSSLPTARTTGRTIVVGVSDTEAGRAAMRFAFAEAAHRRTSVTAVRGWQATATDTATDAATGAPAESSIEPGTENPVEPGTENPNEQPGPPLAELLADWHRQYPDVEVHPLLLPVHPAQAVLQAARAAELVVIGAHHSDNTWSSRLGPVPQTVLHHTNCPVVLVGTPHRARRPGAHPVRV